MTSNKLPYTLALCLLIIFFLFILSVIPEFRIGSLRFKKIDILADIREHSDTLLTTPDSLQIKIDSAAQVAKIGCPKGITCIEDYSKDSTAMLYFIKALNKLKNKGNTLRIAMYGDSFIEGDVFCGSFRDTLQSLFGGDGVGYVPITSDVAGFRRNIKHKFENWNTYSIIKKDSTSKVRLGPAGYSFIPLADNWVEYKPVRKKNVSEFNAMKLYYKNSGHAVIDYYIDDTTYWSEDLKTSRFMQEWKYDGDHAHSVRFEFPNYDSIELYGASFENGKGIYVDNFSMRGNTGLGLSLIQDDMLIGFNKYRNYKLIILQYGLNVSLEDSMKYDWYTSRMIKVVNKMKHDFPYASILLISVSDRSSNTTGAFKTIKTIPVMRNAQRFIAQKTGIAFWDMYEAMGGENSMVKFVKAKPSLAAKDYTHLTFQGGKKLAGLLVKSLLYEKQPHARKSK